VSAARDRFTAFRKSQPRSPRLSRRTVRARGLDFAVFATPEVPGVPPLLCVNGGMIYSHALLWPALAPLAVWRQVVLYDQRGRGASQVPPAIHSSRIDYDAGDIPALREALAVERWDVLGHSWGGGIAMLATDRDPLGVRRLVLVDAVGPTSDWLPALHGDALARLAGAERQALASLDPTTLFAADASLHGDYSRAIYPAWFADPEFAAMFAPSRQASLTGATVAARLRREGYDWREALGRIRASTLVVHGAQDLLPARVARENAALIAGARLVMIDGAGHMPFWEQPEVFFAIVRDFLDAPDRGR
jgi:proline iminopeptidase